MRTGQDQSIVTVVVLTSKGTLLAHGLPAPQPDAALVSGLAAAYGDQHSESACPSYLSNSY